MIVAAGAGLVASTVGDAEASTDAGLLLSHPTANKPSTKMMPGKKPALDGLKSGVLNQSLPKSLIIKTMRHLYISLWILR